MTFTQAITLFVILVAANSIWNSYSRSRNDHGLSVSKVRSEPGTSPNEEVQQSTEENYSKTPFVLLLMIPLLAGILSINYWLREYNIVADSLNWEIVPGEIISKDINRTATSGRLSNETRTYIPSVEYTFTHKGRKYTGTNIDYANRPAYGDVSKSQAVLDLLPNVGEKVDVYVSPDLNNSCLIPGAQHSNPFGIIVGGILLFIGMAGLKRIFDF